MRKALLRSCLALLCFILGAPNLNAATYDVHKGWNLLGAPCRIEVSNFQKDGIKTVWKWKDCGWQAYSSDENIQKLLKAYGIPSFDAVEPLEGFWVNAEKDIKIGGVSGCSLGNETGTVDLNRGLVAYWSFDNCTAVDDSGNGNNGEIFGNITCEKGIKGLAAYFDGSSWIRVEDKKGLLSFDREFTIALWGKPLKSWSDWIVFLTKLGEDSSSLETPYDVVYTYNGIPHIRFYSNNDQNYVTTDDENYKNLINLNKWNFIVWRFRKGILSIFLNGNLVYEKLLPFKALNPENTPLEIGRDTPGATEYYVGYMDEIRFYNRALSDEEVKTLYDMYSKKENKGNLVYNGNFERGTDGWEVVEFTSGAKVSLLEENSNHFIRMHHDTTSDWCSLGQEIASKLEKGKTYVFSYRYRTKDNVALGIHFTEPSTVAHSTAISEDYGWNHKLINDGKWHYDSFEFTVTDSNPKPDEPYLGIFFDYHFKGDVDIDDISITEKE